MPFVCCQTPWYVSRLDASLYLAAILKTSVHSHIFCTQSLNTDFSECCPSYKGSLRTCCI